MRILAKSDQRFLIKLSQYLSLNTLQPFRSELGHNLRVDVVKRNIENVLSGLPQAVLLGLV